MGRIPIVTIADSQRLLRDTAYREAAALRLLKYIDRLESLRNRAAALYPVNGPARL